MTPDGFEIPAAGSTAVSAGGRRVELTSLDRPVWPDGTVTKADVVRWYAAVAGVLLPHVRGRPLTLRRWPDGVAGPGFDPMDCGGAPAWLRTAALTLRDGRVRHHCLVDDLPGLLWVANLGTLELHPYPTRADAHDSPGLLVFDLDPRPPAGLADACRVALRVRDVAAVSGMLAWVKASGAAGLHVLVPLAAGHTIAETRATARWIAHGLAAETPDLVTASTLAADRAGRVFVDWMRNDARRSLIAPYSLRVTPDGLTVSAPLRWQEVEAAAARADAVGLRIGMHAALERLDRLGDLLAGLPHGGKALPAVLDGPA